MNTFGLRQNKKVYSQKLLFTEIKKLNFKKETRIFGKSFKISKFMKE